jgi:ubiquinone/menaquinone biosynthesis C-methylase UbiE
MIRNTFGLQTLLDVGAGTGRGVCLLRDNGKDVREIKPVRAMIEKAEPNGVSSGLFLQGSGYELPFEDAVFECGDLHHVASPAWMVAEMIRVAKQAIVLSDSNRFGQGNHVARLVKGAFYKTNRWQAARFIQTKGKMYNLSEGDGLQYSYCVFDSYDHLAAQTQQTWLLSTAGDGSNRRSWLHPLFTSAHVLLCAFKETPGKLKPSTH